MRRWTVKQVNSSHYYSDVIIAEENSSDIGYECIADVWSPNGSPSTLRSEWSTYADAQLLAAAPELLERLKQLIDLSDGRNPICLALAIKEAQELISKLEGDSNG